MDSEPLGHNGFEIVVRDWGRMKWGENHLLFTIDSHSSRKIYLFIEVEARYSSNQNTYTPGVPGYQVQEIFTIPPGSTIEHDWEYMVSPEHGLLRLSLKACPTEKPDLGKSEYPAEWKFLQHSDRTIPKPNRQKSSLGHIDRLTVGPMRFRTSAHNIVYFLEGSLAQKEIRSILRKREKAVDIICGELDVHYDGRMTVFLFPDEETKILMTGHRGKGFARGETIGEVYNEDTKIDPRHEITHIIASQLGDPPAWLSEGLASYLSSDHPEIYDSQVLAHKDKGDLWPLEALTSFEEIGPRATNPGVSYLQAASLVGYLMGIYGRAILEKLYRTLRSGPRQDEQLQAHNRRILESVLKVALDDLEEMWLKDVRSRACMKLQRGC